MKLKRHNPVFRKALDRARTVVRRCASLRGHYITSKGDPSKHRMARERSIMMPQKDWERRMLWHRAWEKYGNALGKEPADA